jgi:hypothetical protein
MTDKTRTNETTAMMPKYRVVGVLRQRDAGDDRERCGQVHRGESEKDCLDMGDKR